VFIIYKSKIFILTFITFFIFTFINPNKAFSNNEKIDIKNIHQLLKDKKFTETIKKLEELSLENNIKAQLLYSKILFSGDIIPQNFEKSYKWATTSSLGGLKGSSQILKKIKSYLTEEQLIPINEGIEKFLEKRAFINDKRAIIQIAKFYEKKSNPPEMINAYSWYSIAVAKGIKSAKKKRDSILKDLNEKDLTEAQKLSSKLFKQIKN
jgi:TPR repeat protein|tara:strand:- start:215 stop:841 length:627 start_codon:yes stop_codon:yes gene_type:complete